VMSNNYVRREMFDEMRERAEKAEAKLKDYAKLAASYSKSHALAEDSAAMLEDACLKMMPELEKYKAYVAAIRGWCDEFRNSDVRNLGHFIADEIERRLKLVDAQFAARDNDQGRSGRSPAVG